MVPSGAAATAQLPSAPGSAADSRLSPVAGSMAFRYAGLPVDTFQIAVAPLGPGATVPPMSSTSDSGVPRDTTFAVGGRGTASAGGRGGGTRWGGGGTPPSGGCAEGRHELGGDGHRDERAG